MSSLPRMPEPTDEEEVEGNLYDALGHLEAGLAKLHVSEAMAPPPTSQILREQIDRLTDLVDEARELHRKLRGSALGIVVELRPERDDG